MRPVATRGQRYSPACLFDATFPARGRGAVFVLPFANANMIILYLADMCTTMTLGADAVVFADGAGWHKTGTKL